MADAPFDLTRKFVWVNGTLPNGLVEFEFAVGDTDVSVELVMPQAAFEEFCRANAVTLIDPPAAKAEAGSSAAEFQWNLHQATHQRFR